MIQSPCGKCPEKGCGVKHDSCEKYRAWSAEHQKELDANRRDSESYGFKVERIRQFKSEKWKGSGKLK